MFNSVIGVYVKNQSVFAGYPAITECETELEGNAKEIVNINSQYMNATSGKTNKKNSFFDTLIAAAVPVKSALYAYAVRNKMEELKAKTSLTESDLKRLSVSELLTYCNTYLTEARTNLTALANYKITAEKLNVLETKINDLKETDSDKSSSFTSKSALRKMLTEKFRDTSALLNEQYDHVMEVVKEEHEDIYMEYFAARVIKDLGGSHAKEEEAEQPVSGQK
jgi:gas vesicle protein